MRLSCERSRPAPTSSDRDIASCRLSTEAPMAGHSHVGEFGDSAHLYVGIFEWQAKFWDVPSPKNAHERCLTRTAAVIRAAVAVLHAAARLRTVPTARDLVTGRPLAERPSV